MKKKNILCKTCDNKKMHSHLCLQMISQLISYKKYNFVFKMLLQNKEKEKINALWYNKRFFCSKLKVSNLYNTVIWLVDLEWNWDAFYNKVIKLCIIISMYHYINTY